MARSNAVKYSPSRLKVEKYHISIQVMPTWTLRVFNVDMIYRSGDVTSHGYEEIKKTDVFGRGFSSVRNARNVSGGLLPQLWLAVWPFRNNSNKKRIIYIRTRWKHSFALITIFRGRNLSQTISNDFISKGVFTAWMAREVGILAKNCFTIQITRTIYRLVPGMKILQTVLQSIIIFHMPTFVFGWVRNNVKCIVGELG